MSLSGGSERAVVTYPAPHGADGLTLRDGESVLFGRGVECAVRFGFAPVADAALPRIAGSLTAINDRVLIESAAQPGHRAIDIQTSSGCFALAAGEGHVPREHHFELLVRGEQSWKISVSVRPGTRQTGSAIPSTDPPTKRFSLEMTEVQHRILRAYCGGSPTRWGREPATHKEVAAVLNYHPNTVREVLYDIWAKLFELQIPMPDVTDKRIAVLEAVRTHGLLSEDAS